MMGRASRSEEQRREYSRWSKEARVICIFYIPFDLKLQNFEENLSKVQKSEYEEGVFLDEEEEEEKEKVEEKVQEKSSKPKTKKSKQRKDKRSDTTSNMLYQMQSMNFM